MARKSQGYIWLRKAALNKGTHKREQWVGKRYIELVKLLELENYEQLVSRVRINGKEISKWHFLKKLRNGDSVSLICRPEGDDTIGIIINVVLIVVGIILVATGVGAAAGWSLIAAGVTGLASIFLAPSQRTTRRVEDSASQRPEITGASNQISTDVVPVLFGTTQLTPFYGQNPYRWTGDGTPANTLNQYMIPTYNNIEISDEKLGTTSFDDYEGNVTSEFAYGSTSFIGFENIYPKARDEQLTVDETTITNDTVLSANSYTGTTSVQFVINYTTITDINNFTDKEILITGINTGVTNTITIQSTDLVDNGTFYTYTSTPFNLTTTSEKIRFQNNVITQQSANEINDDLRGTFVSYTIGTDSSVINADFDKLEGSPTFIVDSTPENTNSIEWIFSFNGLYRQNNDGSRSARAVNARCRYKEYGAVSYLDLEDATAIYVRKVDGTKVYLTENAGIWSSPDTTTIYNSSTNNITLYSPSDQSVIDELFFRNIGIEVPSLRYTYNVSSTGFVGGKTSSDIGVINLSDVHSIVDGDPINLDIIDDFTQVKVVAKAYKNLSGVLQQYNFVGKSKIPVWNGTDWNTVEASNNPAAVVRYLITDNKVNPRADSVDLIDNDSFVEFYDWCITKGYTANGVISSKQKVLQVVQTILSNCQSTLTMPEGKLAIATDKSKTVSQMITPHNSWDMEAIYSIGKKTDAFRIGYVNEDGYKDAEFTRYYYNNTVNATVEAGKTDADYEIIKKEIEYATNTAHVTALADYQLKTIQERVMELTFKVNLESQTANIYDRVLVSNTSGMSQQYSGRIVEVYRDGSNFITGFRLKSYIELEQPINGSYFKIYIRSIEDLGGGEGRFVVNSFDIAEQNGRFIELSLLTPYDDSGIVTGAGTIVYESASGYYDGDLFDVNDAKIHDCIITEVRPDKELTATIVALETKEGFYS